MATANSVSADSPAPPSGVALEQLDTLVRVTSIHAWVSLWALLGLCLAAVAFAILYRVPKKVYGEGILLIRHDRLSQVRALSTGRIETLNVAIGDEVHPGTEIGRIFQADLDDTISQTSARLAELKKEDRRLSEFETTEGTTQETAIGRLRESIHRTLDNAKESLGVALKILDGAHRLRSSQQLTDLDYLKDMQQKFTIQNDINNGTTRLAEVELTRLSSENQRKRASLQRQLEISRLETQLDLEQKKLRRTSLLLSHAHGTVTQILTATDQFVQEGAPVVLLSSPKISTPGKEDSETAYDSVVFVPAGEGKKVDPTNPVEVMPATVKREEHGFIRGTVLSVSELPATRMAMEVALQHPDLVDSFLKRYNRGVVLRVHIRLEREALPPPVHPNARQITGNPFAWSSSSGRDQPLKTGTICDAAIIVEEQPLIGLILPLIWKSLETK